jgi:catechol 2,3-dioxygenase-like lactoylglutathione lyase family enzyme
MKIVGIASFAVITRDPSTSSALFVDALGLPLAPHEGSEYRFSEKIAGAKHFGVWPLAEAARACFGTEAWPSGHAIPQACVEFEVANEADVEQAAEELAAKGFALLHATRKEPWGQTVARILSSDGVIVGISYAPWLHPFEGEAR